MPNPYATGSIAEVDLEVDGEDMRALILDGWRFLSPRAINNTPAASGTSLYTATMPLTAGIRFGVRLDFSDIDVLKDFVEEILTAIDGQDSFNVTIEDPLHSVDAECVPDGSDWIQYPEQRFTSNQVKSVVMRFVTA